MPVVKFRQFGARPAPQPIRIAVPGWAGDKQPREDGRHEQPRHCLPLSEGARWTSDADTISVGAYRNLARAARAKAKETEP